MDKSYLGRTYLMIREIANKYRGFLMLEWKSNNGEKNIRGCELPDLRKALVKRYTPSAKIGSGAGLHDWSPNRTFGEHTVSYTSIDFFKAHTAKKNDKY